MKKILICILLCSIFSCQKSSNRNNLENSYGLAKELVWDLNVDSKGLSNTKAIIQTDKGNLVMKFYSLLAPKSSELIINLIQNGYFDGGLVSRSFKNYVLQVSPGNRFSTNEGAAEYLYEFNTIQHIRGAVGLVVKESKDLENQSPEFYISLTTLPHLDRKFTIFAQIVDGLDVAEKLQVNDQILKIELQK